MTEADDDTTVNPNSPTAKALQSLLGKGWTLKRVNRKLGIPMSRLSRWARSMGTKSGDDAIRLKELDGNVRLRKKVPPPEHGPAGHQPPQA